MVRKGSSVRVRLRASTQTPAFIVLGALVEVFDGGPDGLATTTGNTLFATEGLFVPLGGSGRHVVPNAIAQVDA
jgi:hypothetical protein